MKNIIDYLGCGNIYIGPMVVDYKISKINDLIDKIFPFFDKYRIVGMKSLDYQDLKKISILIKNGDHLTDEGLYKIKQIKAGINKARENNSNPSVLSFDIGSQSVQPKGESKECDLKIMDFTKLKKISEHIPKHNSN